MSISLTIVAHNEEEHILDTLKPVYDWVDEVILINSASTDNTVAIVEKFDKNKKVKIYNEDNPPNFIINKQKAIEKCTKEWILELDADEIVTSELKKEILNAVENGTHIAYWIPRLNHLLGKPLSKGGQFPDYTIRLYKRGHARFPVKTVHDQVEIDGQATTKGNVIMNEKILHLNSPLLHYPYRDIVTFFRKWSQYAIYDGDEWFKDGIRPSFGSFMKWCVVKPKYWFFLTYFRHRGYVDGFPGFIFSFFSSLRYWVSYMRMYELSNKKG